MTDPNQPYGSQPNPYQQPPAYQQQPSAYQQAPAYQQGGGYGQPATDRYNVLAIVSLVSAFFIPLVAIITGHIGLSQIKKTGEKGRGLAIAGLVLGYLFLLAGILFGVIFFLVLAANPGGFTTPTT